MEVVVNQNTKVTCVDKGEDGRDLEASNKETIAHPTEGEGNMDGPSMDEPNDSTTRSCLKVSEMVSNLLLKYRTVNSETFWACIIVVISDVIELKHLIQGISYLH